MPADLGYGQDTFFDVTSFLSTITSPYVGFNLRSYTGTNVFSSLEYNYGHPSQLSVTTSPVPEPSTIVLMGLGLVGLAGYGRKKIKR